MTQVFKAVSENISIFSSEMELYEFIEGLFESPSAKRQYKFERAKEMSYILKIAENNSDILLNCLSILKSIFEKAGSYPKNYQVLLFKLKRAIADAVSIPMLRHVEEYEIDFDEGYRVVLLLPWAAGNRNNNILRVAAGYLQGLSELKEVSDASILVTNEMGCTYNHLGSSLKGDARKNTENLEAIVEDFSCHKSQIDFLDAPSLQNNNLEQLSNKLIEKKANLVFVINFELTSSYIHAIRKLMPTVFLQTSIRNRPVYDYDQYLYLGGKREIGKDHIHPEKWSFHYFGYPRFSDKGIIDRCSIGADEHDFLVTCAGNRLERELTEDFVDLLSRLMKNNPRVKFCPIGVIDDNAVVQKFPVEVANRVLPIGYVNNISDYLSTMNVYANAPRTGGAVSMALSVFSGTPVISLSNSDACNFLTDDSVVKDKDQYLYKLNNLINEPHILEELAAKQYNRINSKHNVHASATDLLCHFKQALFQSTDRFPFLSSQPMRR